VDHEGDSHDNWTLVQDVPPVSNNTSRGIPHGAQSSLFYLLAALWLMRASPVITASVSTTK
jgi:hypothetical protein